MSELGGEAGNKIILIQFLVYSNHDNQGSSPNVCSNHGNEATLTTGD